MLVCVCVFNYNEHIQSNFQLKRKQKMHGIKAVYSWKLQAQLGLLQAMWQNEIIV